jgi:hypothetical protein
MGSVQPVVRVMLICDDVRPHADNPQKLDIFGLVSRIQPTSDPPFPLMRPELCIFLQLTGGRGAGDGQVVCVDADSGKAVFCSPRRRITFPRNPLSVVGLVYRLFDCPFRKAGLYWVEFRYNGSVLDKQPLLVE